MNKSVKRKVLPVGYVDFKEIIDENLYYVDKTMLIYDILENHEKSLLIMRPRRFGKTLNMSMLRYFFDINEKENAYLFNGLKISEHYGEVQRHRNAYPVISLSLKEAKQDNFDSAFYRIRDEVQKQYEKYGYIWESDKISPQKKQKAEDIMKADADMNALSVSIELLSECLKDYYGKKTFILIDEYDVPLESAYLNGYYDKMLSFIRTLFSSAMKDNVNAAISVITGCLRVSKESVFTGWNNLSINSILSEFYSDCCGFTQREVDDITKYYEIEDKLTDIKQWYDGYSFNGTGIYNPWSVINQIKVWNKNPDADVQTWWINTSGNDIIKTLIKYADADIRDDIERLIRGESIEAFINQTVTYGDLTNDKSNIWSFLLFTGYLKIKSYTRVGTKKRYNMVIPNLEVSECYRDIIIQYFDNITRSADKDYLYKLLINRRPDEFAECITKIMKKTISFYDTAENFYHGFLAGILSEHPDYKVKSNRENGAGRTDLILLQRDGYKNAVILEFKVCRNGMDEEQTAKIALEQINIKGYDEEVKAEGYRNIIKYGMAFCGKSCAAIAGE